MRKFIRNLFLALIPIAVINALCWGTLVFLAWQDDLTYVNYASILDKEKRLKSLSNQSRLIIIGGSNTRFGLDCQILKDTLELEPVNMGIHIGLGLDFMFKHVDDYLQKGDILLVSAEYHNFLSKDIYYGDEGLTDMYLIKHEWRKALWHIIDTHNYFSMYRMIQKRIKRIGLDMSDIPKKMEVRTKYNEFGDYTGHYNLSSSGHWGMEPLPLMPDEKVLLDIKEKIASIRNRGVKIVFLPPPYCRSSFEIDSLAIDHITENLNAIGISFNMKPCETSYSDSLFYDSRYHLTYRGVQLHSRKIAKQLKILLDDLN